MSTPRTLIFACALLLPSLVGVARADLRTLASPGELASPHAALDGQCDRCHVPFKGLPASSCFSCHQRAATQIATGKGFHAGLGDRKCSSCHTDHKGRDQVITPPLDWRFDHARTGYPLIGRHKQAPCSGCHPSTTGGTKWVGADTTCKGCHGDTHHKGALGSQCATCHTTNGWKANLKTGADHKVPMIGKHATLECASCHKGGTHFVAKANCGDCHEQKHGGTRAPCDTCHNPADWKSATFKHDFCTCKLPGKHQTAPCLACHPAYKFLPTPFECAACHKKDLKHEDLGPCSRCHSALSFKVEAFDHDKRVPAFPIKGKHTAVGCENCHTRPGVFRGEKTECEGCHKVPAHGDFGPCASCHTVKGFVPSKFSHAVTRFPLDGKHAAVTCAGCHAKFRPGTYWPGPDDCATCHGDPHKGQFEGGVRPGALRDFTPAAQARLAPNDGSAHVVSQKWSCRDCHDTTRFKPSTVTADSHARFGFPLKGAHHEIDCARCHASGAFANTPAQCASCHTDVHRGRFGADCARCHNERTFRDVPGFDHKAATGFATDGPHEVACAKCHGAERDKLDHVARPVSCAACHAPIHGAQFGGDCRSCHTPTKFSNVPPFPHGERTGFPLERRHGAVACTGCHDARKGAEVPRACSGCHEDPHRGGLGVECADCHRPDRWLLVRFDHDRTEFPLRGRHFVTQCDQCHRNNQWTGVRTECVTCHARDRSSSVGHPKRWDCGSAGCHLPFGWHAFVKPG